MKKFRLINILLVVLLIGTFVLSGCGETSGNATDNSKVQAATKSEAAAASSSEDAGSNLADDQTLNLILGHNVSTLDVTNTGWVTEQQITSVIYETLFRASIDENGKEYYALAGAESYDVSDDGLTYTFHLKDNSWSDGKAVTAQDYVDSFVRVLNAANGIGSVASYNFVKNGRAYYAGEAQASDLGVKAVDEKTLEITFENADFDAIGKIAAVYPIRQDLVNAATSEFGSNFSELAYNGPFVVTEWILDNKLTLKKNPKYWDAENVKLETVNFIYALESGTQATLFDSKQLDIVEQNDDYAAAWDAQAEAGQITSIVQPRAMVRWLIFNQNGKSGLTRNVKTRLAISLAIDRQEYLDTVFGGRYFPAWDFTPYPITVQGLAYNSKDDGTIKRLQAQYDTPEKLQALLKEGLDEIGYTYSELSDVVLYFTDKAENTLDQARIEYLKQAWEKVLGITVQTEVTADFAYMQGDYDVTNATWNSSSPYGSLRIFDQNVGIPILNGQLDDADIQARLDSATGVVDPQKIVEIYKGVEDRLVGEGIIAPIYWGDTRYYQQNYVKNITYRQLSALYDFSRAYIEKH